MKRLFRAASLGLLAFAGTAAAADDAVYDLVQPGQPRYELLRQASAAAGGSGWAQDTLRRGQALPQASARALAAELQDSPALNAAQKKALADAYISEAEAMGGGLHGVHKDTEDLKKDLDVMGEKVAKLSDANARNNYSPLTEPNARITIATAVNASAYNHIFSRERAVVGQGIFGNLLRIDMGGNLGGTSTWTLTLASFLLQPDNAANSVSLYPFVGPLRSGNWGQYMASNDYLSDYKHSSFNEEFTLGDPANSLRLHLDPPGFENLNLVFGLGARGIDPLIFATHVVQTAGEYTVIPAGAGWNGLFIEKTGASGWWIFDEAQMVLAPAWVQLQGESGSRALNRFMTRLDMQGFDVIVLQDVGFFTSVSLDDTEASLNNSPWPNDTPFIRDTDYSVGMQGRLGTGGVFNAEWASADFYSRGPQNHTGGNPPLIKDDLEWKDQAWTASLTQGWGPFNMVLQGSQVGSHYAVFKRQGLYFQGLNSSAKPGANYLDSSLDDPRTPNTFAWQTLAYDSSSVSNNSTRVDLQTSLNNDWVTLSLGGGIVTQIEPTGPWITTARGMNNGAHDGYSWANVFALGNADLSPGNSIPGYVNPALGAVLPGTAANSSAMAAFNAPNTGPAFYRGALVNRFYNGAADPSGKWNWHEIQAPIPFDTYETILLSQNGVGDFNLRADSVKTVNALRGGLGFDLQSLLALKYTSNIDTSFELRDVAEAVQLPGFGGAELLQQSITRVSFSHSLTRDLNVSGGAGYENWRSQASAFPVSDGDTTWGIGGDMRLGRLVAGMTVSTRYNWLSHEDYEYPVRNFSGWNFSVGTKVTY